MNTMKVIILFFILPICSSLALLGQSRQNPVRNIQVNFSERQPVELGYPLYVDLEVILSNGKTRATNNPSIFGLGWSRFNVWVEGGQFRRGKVYVDMAKMEEGLGKEVKLWVSHESNLDLVDTFYYRLPQVRDVKIVPKYPVSIQPGTHQAFSLELIYDNGRSYVERPPRLGPQFPFRGNELGLALTSTALIKNDHFVVLPRSVFYTEELSVVARHPKAKVADTLFIPVDYISEQILDFSGSSGSSGFCGKNGDEGEDGANVEAYVQLVDINDRHMLRIKAVSRGRTDFALIDIEGEGLTINARGGDGGDGGDGDNGDDGKDENDKRQASVGENGGPGGHGGPGGDGGQVVFHTDRASQIFIHKLIKVENDGGDGGEGGDGGDGGDGGTTKAGDRLKDGADGCNGQDGLDGRQGRRARIEVMSPYNLERILTGVGKI